MNYCQMSIESLRKTNCWFPRNMHDETICYLCDKQFKSKSDFESHVSDVHARTINKEYDCELCDKSFPDKHSLASHISKSHRKIPKNQCYISQ